MSALSHFLYVWGDGMLLGEIASQLRCEEAEALADLFRASNMTETGDMLIREHARSDEEDDDQHHDIFLDQHVKGPKTGCKCISGLREQYRCGAKVVPGTDYCLTHQHLVPKPE